MIPTSSSYIASQVSTLRRERFSENRDSKAVENDSVSFVLSTCIHIGLVTGYYALILWLNPDDKGRKDFYSATTVTQGRTLGGGGIQTNHHKSYLFHLVREYYKTLSKLFFVQFSAIYLLLLVLFKFFPEHAKLKEDTAAVFNLSRRQREQDSYNETETEAAARRELETNSRTIPAINQQLRKFNKTKSLLKTTNKNRLTSRTALISLQKNRIRDRRLSKIEDNHQQQIAAVDDYGHEDFEEQGQHNVQKDFFQEEKKQL